MNKKKEEVSRVRKILKPNFEYLFCKTDTYISILYTKNIFQSILMLMKF